MATKNEEVTEIEEEAAVEGPKKGMTAEEYLAEEKRLERMESERYEIAARAHTIILTGKAGHKRRLSSSEHGLSFDAICSSCQFAQVHRRKNQMDVIVHCGILKRIVPSDISECNSYSKPETDARNNIMVMVEICQKAGTMIDILKDEKKAAQERKDQERGYGQYL